MKYIKKFENRERDKNWIVPLKMPDFLLSLKKIGMSKIQIHDWIRLHQSGVFNERGKYPNRKTITIRKDMKYDGFTWSWYPNTESDEYVEFMGEIEFTPEEIAEYLDEIEMRKNVEKYNL